VNEVSDPVLQELLLKFMKRTEGDRSRLAALADRMAPGASEASEEIAQIAHRLVGAAGVFGFSKLSEYARELDVSVQQGCSDPATARENLQKVLAAIDETLLGA
jgi:HPt (histidine-containing phosphotransfer) domain-containing protein